MSRATVKRRSPFNVPPYIDSLPCNQYKDFEWSVTRLSLDRKLPVHSGCVNTVCWSSSGRYLLSGSDDRKLAVTSPFCQEAESHSFMSGHRANIFSAKFLPNSDDLKIVSAAGDGRINLTDLGLGTSSLDADSVRSFACHRATVFDLVTSPSEASVFLSVSADGTLRQFDIREPEAGHTVLLSNQHCRYYGYTAAVVHPTTGQRLFVADKDGYIGEYDRRCIGYGRWVSQSKPVEVLSSKRLVRVTSLSFNPRATHLLASYNGGSLYLFDIRRTVPHSQLTPAPPNPSEDHLCGAVGGVGGDRDGAAAAAEESSRIIFRFRGDWSDTGPESEPPSSDRAGGGGGGGADGGGGGGGASDYSERLGQFMMRAYQLNRQQNPEVGADSQGQSGRQQPEQPLPAQAPEPIRAWPERASPEPGPEPALNARPPNRVRVSASSSFPGGTVAAASEDQASLGGLEQDLDRLHRARDAAVAFEDDDDESRGGGAGGGEGRGGRLRPLSVSAGATSAAESRPGLADSGSQAEAAADYPAYQVCRVFQGHRNARTCIQQAAFWGSEHVISGSDCGHFLAWRVSDGRLLTACLADQRVVNRVVPHPSLLYLATSGIDYDVKLWSPIAAGAGSDEMQAASAAGASVDLAGLVRRNQAMLAQTMNTVTVPGSAMLSIMRMLSRLYSRDAQ